MTWTGERPKGTPLLLLSAGARVRWHAGEVELTTPDGAWVFRSADPGLLHLLHAFARPAREADVLAGLAAQESEGARATIESLRRRGVLLERPSPEALLADPGELPEPAPEAPLRVLFVLAPDLAQLGAIGIPSGVTLLASLAEQAGHETDFLLAASPALLRECPSEALCVPPAGGGPAEALPEFVARLQAALRGALVAGRRPVLALSCFSSALYASTLMLAVVARHGFPRLPILVGGTHATIDPDSLLVEPGDLRADAARAALWEGLGAPLAEAAERALAEVAARGDSIFDFVFVGRAERSFPAVLAGIAAQGARAPRPRLVPPAPFDDAELSAFRYSRSVLARLAGPDGGAQARPDRRFDLCLSLGCPQACHFCINSTRHEPWQGLDVEHALELLEFLHLERHVRRFALLDANFGGSARWRQRFFEGLASRPWASGVQIDFETSVASFDLPDFGVLEGLGLTVQLGVESCSPEMLLRMNKTRDAQRYRARLGTLLDELAPRVDLLGLLLIFGFPGETAGTLRETLDFLLDECRVLERPNVALLAQAYLPLAGTEADRRAAQYHRELGFESPAPGWWRRDPQRRFEGLRPSHSLTLDRCQQLASMVCAYFFPCRPAEAAGPPPLAVQTRLGRQRFRRELRAALEGDGA